MFRTVTDSGVPVQFRAMISKPAVVGAVGVGVGVGVGLGVGAGVGAGDCVIVTVVPQVASIVVRASASALVTVRPHVVFTPTQSVA